MASGTSAAAAAAALLLLVSVLFAAASARADDDDGASIEFSPPRARRAGLPPVPPTPPTPPSIIDGVVRAEKARCQLFREPSLVDGCRSAPGLRGCAAQCVVYHYRGGYCATLPDGRLGDCYCTNCQTNIPPPSYRPAGGGRRSRLAAVSVSG